MSLTEQDGLDVQFWPDGSRLPRMGTQVLLPYERRAIVMHHHPAVLLRPVTYTLVALIIAGALTTVLRDAEIVDAVLWMAWLLTLGYLLLRVLNWSHNRLVVTENRMIYVCGFLTRTVMMTALTKGTDLHVKRTLLGKLLGYGTIRLDSESEYHQLRNVPYLPYPEQVFIRISALIFETDD